MPLEPQQLREYLNFAAALAEAAGKITLKYFKTALHVESKSDASPVTIADRETEQFIRAEISRVYPTHGILGEEFGETNPGAKLRWIVDPIDGTKAFIHGVPLYTVLLAPECEGEAVVGIVHCPPLAETAAAAVGLGCTLNGTPCRVSGRSELAEARLQCTDFADFMQRWPRLCTNALNTVKFSRSWADAYGYLLVASGRAEVMLDPIMNLWDMAALVPVITEAGGRFTDLTGKPGMYGTSALATNGLVHDAVLALNA